MNHQERSSTAPFSKYRVSAAEVVFSFNTWRFKREQPSLPDELEAAAAHALALGEPVSFVLYWGKGLRASSASPERRCLEYLGSMRNRIALRYPPGARFHILYTDTHARLNGHGDAAIQAYRASLEAIADPWLFPVRLLSEVCDRASVTEEEVNAYPVAREELSDRLVKCARKWYRGRGEAHDGACRYLDLNMTERLAVQKLYAKSIFLTFNGSELKDLFPPAMPIFYMYSIKKGTSTKPWFMDEAIDPPERADVFKDREDSRQQIY